MRAAALPGGPLDALAYRFEASGRSIVVSGTGWAPDALVGFARGASVLVHEAAFIPEPEIARELGIDAEAERLRREIALHTRSRTWGRSRRGRASTRSCSCACVRRRSSTSRSRAWSTTPSPAGS